MSVKTIRVMRDIRCSGPGIGNRPCNKLLTRLVFEIPESERDTVVHAKIYTETKCVRCRALHCSLSIV